jgi:protein-S-isoprenylcysteine O-methyltransferase Ste14
VPGLNKNAFMENSKNNQETDREYVRILAKGLIVILILMVILFWSAGRIDYWQGWVLFVLILIRIAVGSRIIPHKKELIIERIRPGPGTKRWDKIIRVFLIPVSLAMLIVAPLDAGRFNWSIPFPISVYAASYLLFITSLFIGLWAVRVNKFFSSVVRIQTDRGHVVVESGPYRFIRHPGYAGMILMIISLPLLLGSLWALIPAGIGVILIIIRTYLEDITLQKELRGYKDYIMKVKHMLVPGIW